MLGRIKVPRKVRNQVANFFGEPIELPQIDSKTIIRILDVTNTDNPKQLLSISLYETIGNIEPGQKKNMVSENEAIKIYWILKPMERTLSFNSSEFSQDLANIDTPVRLNFFKEDERYRIFSPMPRRFRKDQVIDDLQEIQSDKGDSSPQFETFSRKGKKEVKEHLLALHEIKNKQSEKTRSKTQNKKNKVERCLSFENKKSQKNVVREELLKIANDQRYQKRRHSISSRINPTGAAMVGTFGALLGLFGGMACPRSL